MTLALFEDAICQDLKKILSADIALEQPSSPDLGDFAFPCFQLSKQLKKNPAQIAQDIAKEFPVGEWVEKVEAKGPYVNFFINKRTLARETLTAVQKQQEKYGSTADGKGKNIVIDFSHPNIAKPFGIGHLRSTMIGGSLYKIFNHLGYKSIGVNHLGDWGTQFGKLITAYKMWGDQKKLEDAPIKHLFDLYVQFHTEAEIRPELDDDARAWFLKLERGDKDALKLWELFREVSLEEFQKLYKMLEIHFDTWDGESFYNDKMEATIAECKKKKLTQTSEGALIIPMDGLGRTDVPPLMLAKKDEASTYATRDLAAAQYRLKTYKPEQVIYVVGTPQKLHFEQVFHALSLLGLPAEKFVHVDFGHMNFPEGKMQTRKGNIIFLEEVLHQAIERAMKIIEEKNPDLENKKDVAQMIGIGAVDRKSVV